MTPARALIDEVARLGVELRSVGDQLQIRPASRLPAGLRDELRRRRLEIVAALEAEERRAEAAANTWERLRLAYELAGRPAGWLTSDVRSAEDVVSKLWVSSRENRGDDRRFHAALQRWEAIATAAITEAAQRPADDGRKSPDRREESRCPAGTQSS